MWPWASHLSWIISSHLAEYLVTGFRWFWKRSEAGGLHSPPSLKTKSVQAISLFLWWHGLLQQRRTNTYTHTYHDLFTTWPMISQRQLGESMDRMLGLESGTLICVGSTLASGIDSLWDSGQVTESCLLQFPHYYNELEKEMGNHANIFCQENPKWGSLRVKHDWKTEQHSSSLRLTFDKTIHPPLNNLVKSLSAQLGWSVDSRHTRLLPCQHGRATKTCTLLG